VQDSTGASDARAKRGLSGIGRSRWAPWLVRCALGGRDAGAERSATSSKGGCYHARRLLPPTVTAYRASRSSGPVVMVATE